jgi:hypothetical protein
MLHPAQPGHAGALEVHEIVANPLDHRPGQGGRANVGVKYFPVTGACGGYNIHGRQIRSSALVRLETIIPHASSVASAFSVIKHVL